MNGGVSLAVWMAGVTHEINNARLASLGDAPENRVRGAWSAVLAEAGVALTIDVVAGASAGGLNGAVLARSIALDCDLPSLKTLWLDKAALIPGKLLRWTPFMLARSLLDGDYFLREVRNLLNRVSAQSGAGHSDVPTVTLLVTATALLLEQSQSGSVGDGAGPDSRRVYRFVSRPGLDADFGGVRGLPGILPLQDFRDVDTLALAARASASFPAAFQPVVEQERLQRQQLHVDTPADRWLMDGGVLDNAPFEPLLDDLRARPVDGLYRRAVVYINPSAAPPPTERPVRQDYGQQDSGLRNLLSREAEEGRGPGLVATLAGTVRAWREVDRRVDGERLTEARRLARYTIGQPEAILDGLYSQPAGPITKNQLAAAAEAQFAQYRLSRAQALLVAASGNALGEMGQTDDLEVVPEILLPSECAAFVGSRWYWGLTAGDRVLRWWGRVLRRRNQVQQSLRAFDALAPAQTIVQHWLAFANSCTAPYQGDRRKWLKALVEFNKDNNLPLTVAALLERAARGVAPALGAVNTDELLQVSIELEVVSRATPWRPDEVTDVPPFEYWEVTPGARDLCGLGPSDVEPPAWASRKLYGERWGNFGAFASRKGRAWDWVWGRIDAATTISDYVLKEAGLGEDRRLTLQLALIQAILEDEGITARQLREGAHHMKNLTGAGLLMEWLGLRRSRLGIELRD
jgi:predicted acylesterase/phospholipase RssA